MRKRDSFAKSGKKWEGEGFELIRKVEENVCEVLYIKYI